MILRAWCGWGKSTAILVACVSSFRCGEHVLAVAPFRRAKLQLMEKARGLGIRAQLLHSRSAATISLLVSPHLLVLAADSLLHSPVQICVSALTISKRVRLCFWDELHVAWTQDHFRDKLRRSLSFVSSLPAVRVS